MHRLLITTVGTSLLTSRAPHDWVWTRGDKLPCSKEVDDWLVNANPINVSAETNTLHRLKIDEETDRISFLHSDTPEGKYCSERLGTYYSKKCRKVRQCPLNALSDSDKGFAQHGLKNLVSVTLNEVTKAKTLKLKPVFCATGGFKAEIAFLNLLGALLGIEVYYIHELHSELVLLPQLPLTWDTEHVVTHYQPFFEWILNGEGGKRKEKDANTWLSAQDDLRSLVVEDKHGNIELNAAGYLLFEAALFHTPRPRAVWPEASPLSPRKKNKISVEQHKKPKGWEKFVESLCKIDCISQVFYDARMHGGEVVKVVDEEKGTLGVRFGPTGEELPLRIETTAKGNDQAGLIARHIRSIRNDS